MNRRRLRELSFSGTGLGLILFALAAANVVAHYWYARLDLSAGRAYSISSGTKAVLSRLKDNLVIRVYFTPHLPPPYGLTEQYLRDLLGEYRGAGRGRVRIEFLDPAASEARQQEAAQAGVASVPINLMSRDKFEATDAMMGVLFLYQGRTEVLPVVEDPDDLEYALTRRIKRLVDPTPKTLGFVSGHGEKSPDDPSLARLFSLIREEMKVRSISLEKPLPADLDALWIVEPTSRLEPGELAALKAWVAGGKTLGLVAGRRVIDFRRFVAAPLDTGLAGLLADWGLALREGLVADAICERIGKETRYGDIIAPYPYMPIAKRLNADNPATRNLDSITFRFVHPLEFRAGSGARYTSLADSSRMSLYRTASDVSPATPIEALKTAADGPFSLAGVLEPPRGKVIVIGSQYAIDARLPNQPTSLAFFLNLLDWSVQDQELAAIRAKGLAFRPLRPLSDGQRAGVKWLMVLVLPISLLFCAAASFLGRRAARARLPGLYADAE